MQAATYYDANQWWLGMRIDTLSACLSLGVTFFAVYNRQRLSPVTIGLLLAQTTKAIQTFRWVLKRSVEVEAKAVCLERVAAYSDLRTPVNAGAHLPTSDMQFSPG